MAVCKERQRQLALLSVQALDEREKVAVLAHVNECTDCRAYWARVQGVVALYHEHAEQSIEPIGAPLVVRAKRVSAAFGWFTWPRAVAFAAAVVLACATLVLIRDEPGQPEMGIPVASRATETSIPRVADSRRLVNEELEVLPETVRYRPRSDFVFSVGTRNEGP